MYYFLSFNCIPVSLSYLFYQFTGTPISHTSERSSQNSASSAGSTKQLLPKPTPVQNESTIVKVIPRGGTEKEDDDLDEDLC